MPATARPNILLIMTDQQRFDAMGCMGNPDVITPNLDRLAVEGVVFENAYTSRPVCVPARRALLTGKPNRFKRAGAIVEEEWNFVRHLQGAGYHTGMVGKLHAHPDMYPDLGFDIMWLNEHHASPPEWQGKDDYHKWANAEGKREWQEEWQFPPHYVNAPAEYRESLQAQMYPYEEKYHNTTWTGEQAVRSLRERPDDKPFCLKVSFMKPHHPFNPTERHVAMYDQAALTLPATWGDGRKDLLESMPPTMRAALEADKAHGSFPLEYLDEKLLRKILAYYYATITHIDEQIGAILEEVDLDSTTVFFTADHGDYMGSKGRLFKCPNEPIDDIARIPFLIAGHGVANCGIRVQEPVSIVDIAPTILSLCGEGCSEAEGLDLAPVVAGDAAIPEDRAVFCYGREWIAVRRGDWKYLHPTGEAEPVLFNLREDPLETRDRATDPACAVLCNELVGLVRDDFD